MVKVGSLVSGNQGTAGLEYALLVSLIGMLILGGLHLLEGGILGGFLNISETLGSVIVLDSKSSFPQ